MHENRTVDAFEFGIECPQIRLFDDKMISDTEDCLFINVYVPEVRSWVCNLEECKYLEGLTTCFLLGENREVTGAFLCSWRSFY